MWLRLAMIYCIIAFVGLQIAHRQQDLRKELVIDGRNDVNGRLRQLTNSELTDNCLALADGYMSLPGDETRIYPKFKSERDCSSNSRILTISVTHENINNNHNGAKNSDPRIRSYMSDFSESARGSWFDVKFNKQTARRFDIIVWLDTVAHNDINVTGWPIRDGHLFLGLGDPSVKDTIDRDVFVDFYARALVGKVRSDLYQGYSGRRLMVGAKARWVERDRQNQDHYLEINLTQTAGYSGSYRDPVRPLCKDRQYDRCFYDPNGVFAEGRELSLQMISEGENLDDASGWTHISVPVSKLIRGLRWVSPPRNWGEAVLEGVYFGIESEGATRTKIEIRNYTAYAE